jgi:hypothetical protein
MARNEFDLLDMLGVSKKWLEPPLITLIESIPAARGVIPDLMAAHQGLFLPAKKPDGPGAAVVAIRDEQKLLDVRYDDLLHGGYWVLTGLASLAMDVLERAAYLSLRDTLFPTGIAGTQLSYSKEGSAATLLEGRLTDSERAVLEQIPLPKNLTREPNLLSAIDEHIEKGKRIGVLEEEKKKKKKQGSEAAVITGPNVAEVRRAWLGAAKALETVLGLRSVAPEDRDIILAPLLEAEERYDNKAKKAAPTETAPTVEEKKEEQ